uniref:Movement protein n=1 Tax=Parascaris univalens TaxID=6257 RepID=A0A914ZPA2_PARUN
MESNYVGSPSHASFPSTSTVLHKQGAFDMDEKAILRSAVVIGALACSIAVWAIIKLYRKGSRNRVRRYDLLSVKQLSPDLVVDSEGSEDELFESTALDDANRRLVSNSR